VKHHSVNAQLRKAQLNLLVNSRRPIVISLEIKVCFPLIKPAKAR